MRKNNEPLKLFLTKNHSSTSNKEKENHRQSQKSLIIKINKNEQKGGKDDLIANAYKKVIKVIENLLGNINDEKRDSKSNLKYINETSQRLRKASVNKNPIQKNISYTPEKQVSSFNKLFKGNSFIKKPIYKLNSINIIKRKNKNENVNNTLNSSINLIKRKNKFSLLNPITKNNLQVKNSFFKAKNKLNKKLVIHKKIDF